MADLLFVWMKVCLDLWCVPQPKIAARRPGRVHWYDVEDE